MTKPIVFIVFNRPDTTQQVFEAIRKYKPEKLFVIADGPRVEKENERELCEQTRAVTEKNIDWTCDVYRNYSDINLGCRRRVSTGLKWVFEHVEDAIILEDDCLPNESFFLFCEELLDKYHEDNRIAVISGNNFQMGETRTTDSYYFSRYNHCWGWATWKRAWNHYDYEMEAWPEIRDGGWLEDILIDPLVTEYWFSVFENVYRGKLDSWASIWTLSCWQQNMLSILPNKNLVKNIGFDDRATHTKNSESHLANMSTYSLHFPLTHPKTVIRNQKTDAITDKVIYNIFSTVSKKREAFYYLELLLDDVLNDYTKININLQKHKNKQIYIFGTGRVSNLIHKLLIENNIDINGYLDNNLERQGNYKNGVLITTPNVLLDQRKINNILVIVTIEGQHDYLVIRQLKELNSSIEIISWKCMI